MKEYEDKNCNVCIYSWNKMIPKNEEKNQYCYMFEKFNKGCKRWKKYHPYNFYFKKED